MKPVFTITFAPIFRYAWFFACRYFQVGKKYIFVYGGGIKFHKITMFVQETI